MSGNDADKLFIALVEMADENGCVREAPFPVLAKRAGVGLRSIPRHIRRLEEYGLITVDHERGRARRNIYWIRPHKETPHAE